MERSLARLVSEGKVAPLEAEKWADDHNTFLDEMRRVNEVAEVAHLEAEAAEEAAAKEAEKQAAADALKAAADKMAARKKTDYRD